jgi:ribosomal protein S1
MIKAGDLVDAIVIGDDKDSGLFMLSLRKASQIKLIAKLHSNFDTKEIITVIPNEANK